MRRVTLSQLAPKRVQNVLDQEGILGAVRTTDGMVIAFGPACTLDTEELALEAYPDAEALWSRGFVAPLGTSRTSKALHLLSQNERLTPHAAAKQAGVHVSAVYRALDKQAEKGVCPCCGQLLKKP